jgi:copper(I)-binding protein
MKIIFSRALGNALLLSLILSHPVSTLAAQKDAASSQPSIPKQKAAITASNAVIILPLGQSRDTRLFFTLNNHSPKSVVLTSITSTQVGAIEWVPAQQQQGQVNPWAIAVNQSLVLDGKARYLQVKGLKHNISTGDEIEFELGFSDGSSMLMVAKARSAYDQIHGH